MADPELRISVRSHHFKVDRISLRARKAVENFARKYIQYGFSGNPSSGNHAKVALTVFATATDDRREFRFHINQLQEFEEHLDRDYIRGNMIAREIEPIPASVAVNFNMRPGWTPKPEQVQSVEFLRSKEGSRAKMLGAKTGAGKSFMASLVIAEDGQRAVGIMKPKYVEKWVDDAHKYWDIAPDQVLVVRGSDQLMALLMMAKSGQLNAAFIIISNKTMQNWMKLYKLHGAEILNMGYECLPDQLFETLGAGIRLIDEVHEDFHLNFIIDLYTNVAKSISLSATLTSYDPFLERMYAVAYPLNTRFIGEKGEAFATARAVFWNFRYPNKARYKDPRTKNYSQHTLEQYILKNDDITANYLSMCGKLIHTSFKGDYAPGDTAIVYAASIDMCTALTSYFEKKYPNLNVKRYVEDDSYEEMLKADLKISTIGSAGTGFDMPGLKTVLMTPAMLSKQGNIQGFGRLRQIKGKNQEFLYLVNGDIPKQIEYHQKKAVLLKAEAKVFRSDTYAELV